jgi:hypothetical protein
MDAKLGQLVGYRPANTARPTSNKCGRRHLLDSLLHHTVWLRPLPSHLGRVLDGGNVAYSTLKGYTAILNIIYSHSK